MVTYVNGCYYYAWNFTPGSGQNVHTVNGTCALCSALKFNGTNVVYFALYIYACKLCSSQLNEAEHHWCMQDSMLPGCYRVLNGEIR